MSTKEQFQLNEGRVYVDEGPCEKLRGLFKSRLGRSICCFIVLAAVVLAIWTAVTRSNDTTCHDVGISERHCAILFDAENCASSSGLLKIKNGDGGRLPKWSPFPSSELQRNDVESLVIQSHCQLELWDDDDGLEMGAVPDIIIDNTYFTSAKYIDSFKDYPSIKHMDEAVSAYRCTCKKPDLTLKFWESEKKSKNTWSDSDIGIMFRLLDTDQDGSLSLEEFQKPVKKDASKLFRACDFNDDNAVDFREFKIMFSNI